MGATTTTSKTVIGSANYLEIFAPAAAGCGWAGTSAFIFDRNVSIDVSGHPKLGKLSIDLESETDDTAYNTFVNDYFSDASVDDVESIYCNGAKLTDTSGIDASNPFIYVLYCATDNDGKRKMVSGRGILTSDNAFNYADKKHASTKVSIKTISGAEVKVATAKFCSDLVSGAADVTISSTAKGCVWHMTAI